jgi:hypothetical protein
VPITPSAASWDTLDDRGVACFVFDGKRKMMTGSMAGAGY